MKKIDSWVILCCLLIPILLVSCHDDDKIDYNDMPEAIHTFINDYFPGTTVTKSEKISGEAHYKVNLSNGFELKFYKEGGWQEIDGNNQPLPQALLYEILPGNVITYVATQYPAASVVEAERHDYGYKIELNTAPEVDLKFDNDGLIIQS